MFDPLARSAEVVAVRWVFRAAVVMTAALATTVLSGCGAGAGPSETAPVERSDVEETETSPLDDDGIERIRATGEAFVDLRDASLTRAELGLQPGQAGPIVDADGGEVELVLLAPEGEERVRTASFAVALEDSGDAAVELTWFESHASKEEADDALVGALRERGLRQDDVRRWRGRLTAEGSATQTFATGVSASGLVMQLTAQGQRGGGQVHQWVVLLAPHLYEPAALEEVRRTGELPVP